MACFEMYTKSWSHFIIILKNLHTYFISEHKQSSLDHIIKFTKSYKLQSDVGCIKAYIIDLVSGVC